MTTKVCKKVLNRRSAHQTSGQIYDADVLPSQHIPVGVGNGSKVIERMTKDEI